MWHTTSLPWANWQRPLYKQVPFSCRSCYDRTNSSQLGHVLHHPVVLPLGELHVRDLAALESEPGDHYRPGQEMPHTAPGSPPRLQLWPRVWGPEAGEQGQLLEYAGRHHVGGQR